MIDRDRLLDLLSDGGIWLAGAMERLGVWAFWFGWLAGLALLIGKGCPANAAPLPFPRANVGTYRTPGGYVLRLEAGGRASYGHAYHPGVSRADDCWGDEGGMVWVRAGGLTYWFKRSELRVENGQR